MEFDNKRLNPKFKKSASRDGIITFKVREARWTSWLSFNKMKLHTIPTCIYAKLRNLKHLYLSECSLSASLPIELGYLKNLEVIDLSINKILSIPDALFPHLTRLRTLDLRSNRLTSLPYTLEYLTNLEELSVAQNQLVAIPHSIGRLPSLKLLDCSENLIRELQGEMFTYAMKDSLRVLNLDSNLLEKMPRQIGMLVRLEELGIAYNNLYVMPPTTEKLIHLQVFRFCGNKWSTPLCTKQDIDFDPNTSFGSAALTKVHSLVCGPE